MSSADRVRRVPRAVAVLIVVAALATLTACDGSGFDPGAGADDVDAPGARASAPDPVVTINVDDDATGVPVDTLLRAVVSDGVLKTVTVRSETDEVVPGKVGQDGRRWVASDRLEPGVRYRVRSVAVGANGRRVKQAMSFTTQALSLAQQTYPSLSPLDGETVGIGMPVVVTFDVPVTDHASFEKHMVVTSTPAQTGSWRWLNDREAHWRPERYWQAGTEVDVSLDLNGVAAGGGVHGQTDRDIGFTVGAAHIYKVNAKTHQMKVFENGTLLRTLPVTTGKSGFITRSGVKVIMGKSDSRRMNSETVGIPRDSADAYDIDDVKWAMRLTSSGEFIHAAPWSVGSQGRANVSHGCTGLSTEDAGWLYAMSRRGDVVTFTGTDRPMEPDNGYGDWNVSWADYQAGSALG